MTNEKVMRSPASLRDAITRTGARRGSTKGGTLLSALRRRIRRAAVARELMALDDRMLADIGLERWQIDEVADRVTAESEPSDEPAIETLGRFIRSRLIEPVRRAYRERTAYRELSALDDRMLKDIGLTRGDIATVVRAAAAAEDQARTDAEEHDFVASLRLWNRSRSAAKALNALDDRMLSDIGILRGDVTRVADEMARRSLKRPANRNRAPEAA